MIWNATPRAQAAKESTRTTPITMCTFLDLPGQYLTRRSGRGRRNDGRAILTILMVMMLLCTCAGGEGKKIILFVDGAKCRCMLFNNEWICR